MNTKLGFGTSGLMGSAVTNRGRLRLLECAFDQGINHFDTAPLYGKGEAETVIGKFAQRRRSDITITTKFGLPATPIPIYLRPIKPILRYANRHFPSLNTATKKLKLLKQMLGPAKDIGSTLVQEPVKLAPVQYDFNLLESELNQSLKKLKTDYIDFYLFHEGQLCDVSEELIDKLNSLVRAGKIKEYGLASGRHTSKSVVAAYPNFSGVIQTNHCFDYLDDSLNRANNLFVHSVFNQIFYHKIQKVVESNPEYIASLLERIRLSTDIEYAAQSICLNAALHYQACSKVVFSTSKTDHILANINHVSNTFNHSEFNSFYMGLIKQ